MTHVRKQIRDLAIDLATGLPSTGTRVFGTRLRPLAQAELPCWIVSTDQDETAELTNLASRQARSLALQFSGYARAVEGVEDMLDEMAAELETVMVRSEFSMVKALELESTEFSLTAEELDNLFGVVTITYRVLYHTAQGAPDLAI